MEEIVNQLIYFGEVMGFYKSIGVNPIINAAGPLTRLGGSRLNAEVLAAMAEASASFVHIDELQTQAGKVIAQITGAEAGYIVNGAAAGLSLATAACVAGLDVGKMDRLPDTDGMKNEVVVQRGHRNSYDHAIRAVGVRMVEVGYLGHPGAGSTQPWQIQEAINDRTAAVACPILSTTGTVSLAEVCAIAHAKNVPVIVDAAAQLPPRTNLRRFIEQGADLVVFSGGKSIGGPQASGILAGRAELIASVALQHQDMDVSSATWNKRALLAAGKVGGIPHQGFGRSMKVGREEVAGLVTALRQYALGDDHLDAVHWCSILDIIQPMLEGILGVRVERTQTPIKPIPTLSIRLDQNLLKCSGYHIVNLLLAGDPPIAIGESFADLDVLIINPQGLTTDEASVVGVQLRKLLVAQQ